jgi:peroxiredoxin Q/BCP
MYSQKTLSVGDKSPLFKATADDGSTWDLSKYIGKDNIVIFFFPGAMTGGCTKQACSYRYHQDDLASADAIVVGISSDKIESLKLFRKAEGLNFPLLSDEKGSIANSFGVPLGEGASIKRTVDGIEHELVRDISIKRWTFIVGKDGKIIYKNEAVNAEKDSEEVLNFLSMQK